VGHSHTGKHRLAERLTRRSRDGRSRNERMPRSAQPIDQAVQRVDKTRGM
jgi:hypothetical protein